MYQPNRHMCRGITSSGERCMNRAQPEITRCKIHQNVLISNGPHTTELIELTYTQERELLQLRNRNANDDPNREDEILQTIDRHIEERRQVVERHRQEVARTGVDPDAAANERKRIERERKRVRAQQQRQQRRRAEMDQLLQRANNDNFGLNNVQPIVNNVQVVRQQGELQRIVNDSQNVHTTPVVNMVNKTIAAILKVPVPADYQWNMTTCSKTPGDIVVHCKLTPKGAWQMTSQYCQDVNVYNLGNGIYGKVLDCVWQYILSSKDKDELMKILRQEMEDNIGKCAQGNLTRLCNILGGYMDDIKIKEPIAEVLGRKIPQLFEIEDIEQRVQTAYKILVEEGVPQSQWLDWLNPLINDDDDEKWYRIEILNDSSTGRIELVEIPYEINHEA